MTIWFTQTQNSAIIFLFYVGKYPLKIAKPDKGLHASKNFRHRECSVENNIESEESTKNRLKMLIGFENLKIF